MFNNFFWLLSLQYFTDCTPSNSLKLNTKWMNELCFCIMKALLKTANYCEEMHGTKNEIEEIRNDIIVYLITGRSSYIY